MPRRGLTLIELLLVVGIVALLVGLTIPAVQSAREASRRAQCLANLRQIGLAFHNYLSREGTFPTAMMKGTALTSTPGLSAFARALPDLEQRPLFNAINFERAQNMIEVAKVNQTALAPRLSVMNCPSDGAEEAPGQGGANYRVNLGANALNFPELDEPGTEGAFSLERWTRLSDFQDGTSTTALASERLRGDLDPSRWSRERDYWASGLKGGPTTAQILARCAGPVLEFPHFSRSGWTWGLSGFDTTWYNHAVVPNALTADCSTAAIEHVERGNSGSGPFSARSHHHGGAHVLFGDGSVRWAKSLVALEVWRALGTRSGGEPHGPGSL